VFLDFHVPAPPGSSRAHRDVRLEKSVPTARISSSLLSTFDDIDMFANVWLVEKTFFQLTNHSVVPYSGTQNKIDTAINAWQRPINLVNGVL
jgi:hypothetical protein